MATLREIKRRIVTITSTEKITRAMKMVAAVKFRRAHENIISARPYARKISEILTNLIPSIENLDNELLEEREVKKICLVIVSSDRGLCGSFNTNLIKAAHKSITENYNEYSKSGSLSLITVGKKCFDHFYKKSYNIYAKYTGVFDRLEFTTAQNIVKEILSGYKSKRFDKVVIIYNEFKSVIQSKVIEEQFLPIVSIDDGKNTNRKISQYIFEPSAKYIVDYLLPKHLNTQIWRVLLESYASEQASRMTAMDSATNNANKLMKELQIYFNKARQAAITKEILEVVSGAEALRESS